MRRAFFSGPRSTMTTRAARGLPPCGLPDFFSDFEA
jgi:hypothetical protein